MVPPESFSTEAPHSSNAFCSGCDGGTQCESLSSKVLSWASVGVGAPIRAARAAAQRPACKRDNIKFLLGSSVGYAANFFIIQPHVADVVKAVSYTHLRAHETVLDLVCRLLL